MFAVLALFYAVFLSQIFLLSIHYPGKLCRRIRYVLEHFPPAQYPKLYPTCSDGFMEREAAMLRLYRAVNYTIAAAGALVLLAMALSGYRPDVKGGDEIFVAIYFVLQVCPYLYVEIKEFRHYRLMRRALSATTRTAQLRPRRLFDFISPVYVAAAVLLYVVWLAVYLGGQDPGSPWQAEVYATLMLISGINLLYMGLIARFLYGRKLDPHQAYGDQLKHMESVVKVAVFSSIGISIFLIATQAVDRYGLEILDPPLVSLYVQLCAIFAIGLSMRTNALEGTDFSVYKSDGSAA